jgi:hypothetical protein
MPGGTILLYSTAFHVLAGTLAGSVFRVRTLQLLLLLVLLEAGVAAIIYGSVAAWWALANLVGLQIGYFIGAFGRSVIENSAQARAGVRQRHIP